MQPECLPGRLRDGFPRYWLSARSSSGLQPECLPGRLAGTLSRSDGVEADGACNRMNTMHATKTEDPLTAIPEHLFDAAYGSRFRMHESGENACIRDCSFLLCRGGVRWRYPEATWTRPSWMGLWAPEPGGAVTSVGKRFDLTPDGIVVIPPGTVYGTDCLQPFRCVLVTITTLSFHTTCPLEVAVLKDEHLLRQIVDIVTGLETTPSDSVSLSVLSLAYGILSKMPPVFHRRQQLPSHIRQALDYMDENLTRNIANQELADVVHMQRTAFVRAFHRAVGTPPQAFFRRQRIDEACRRLLEPDGQVTEIAADMGFTDPSYFCRVFRQLMETTPARWQREALNLPS